MLIEQELKLKEDLKETKVLLDKLYTLIFIQSKEIDLIHFKLFRLEKNYKKALDVLDISKNIPNELKDKLRTSLENEIEKETIKELEEIKESSGKLL